MDKNEAINNIKGIGEILYFSVSVIGEIPGLSKEEKKEKRNAIIEGQVQESKNYLDILTEEEIRNYLIDGIMGVARRRKTDKEIEI